MAKDFAVDFYHSKKWKAARTAYIQKRILIDGGLCEICHDASGYIVHHKIKLTAANINNPQIALNDANFQYVCKKCHDTEHYADFFGKKPAKCCGFDEDGQPIPPPFPNQCQSFFHR